ncbi:putative RNA-directed DNA polymerase, eukaryota, reverse transcriptase zinc-binding domain protein [Tanacetum coccineum]
MSKMDRFLVSDSIYDTFPHTTGVVLAKGILNHRPILLKEYEVDYGPTPFWFFHSWMEMKGFHNLVVDTWKNDGIVEVNGLISFKKKLQNLEHVICQWVVSQRSDSYSHRKEHQSRLSSFDAKIDQGCASKEDFINRRNSINVLGEIDRLEAKDIAQKAKINWVMERDEISKFMAHFRNRFQCPNEIPRSLEADMLNRFPANQIFTTFWDLLEADVLHFVLEFYHSETFPKGCNSSFIALIPKVSNSKFVTDFRPINLIGCQYKIISKILVNRHSTMIRSCISAEQTAFIKGRHILDDHLNLIEVVAWYRKRKKELMIFKLDFEKAFDSLRWDFLDLVMDKLSFCFKWRSWIYCCLRKAHFLVLVNGSPTVEFEIFRGLRQGDPLSYFLIILAMEGLYAITCKSVEMRIYRGTTFGNGVYDSDDDVSNMANVIGCGATKFHLKYLGVPVGCNMARCSN